MLDGFEFDAQLDLPKREADLNALNLYMNFASRSQGAEQPDFLNFTDTPIPGFAPKVVTDSKDASDPVQALKNATKPEERASRVS